MNSAPDLVQINGDGWRGYSIPTSRSLSIQFGNTLCVPQGVIPSEFRRADKKQKNNNNSKKTLNNENKNSRKYKRTGKRAPLTPNTQVNRHYSFNYSCNYYMYMQQEVLPLVTLLTKKHISSTLHTASDPAMLPFRL